MTSSMKAIVTPITILQPTVVAGDSRNPGTAGTAAAELERGF